MNILEYREKLWILTMLTVSESFDITHCLKVENQRFGCRISFHLQVQRGTQGLGLALYSVTTTASCSASLPLVDGSRPSLINLVGIWCRRRNIWTENKGKTVFANYSVFLISFKGRIIMTMKNNK